MKPVETHWKTILLQVQRLYEILHYLEGTSHLLVKEKEMHRLLIDCHDPR